MKEYKTTIPEIELKYKSGNVFKSKILSSMDAYEVFQKLYDQDTIELYETVIVLFVNSANNTIGWMKHSTGGLSFSTIDPRLIYGTALKCGAMGVMISHNHPSGSLKPSDSDKHLTKKLLEGSKYLGIVLIDHIIVSPEGGYYSFADDGEL